MGDRKVEVEITTGLLNKSGDSDNSYGVFLYCNNRMIARGLTNFSVGFSPGQIGVPHYNISLVRTIITLKGQSRDMPWNSSKSGIDEKHPIFNALRASIIEPTKRFSKVCRSLQGRWDNAVFAYNTGTIRVELLQEIREIPKRYFPILPPSKPRWQDKIAQKNASLIKRKPWVSGLQDSIIAADLIERSNLKQKNRIALIIIDSTLEIAYKEYLVNEQKIGKQTFEKISGTRSDIQKKVFETIVVSGHDQQKIEYYYKLRNDLIHQRATPNVLDEQVEDYREIVEDLLEKMFGVKCR